VSEVVTVAQDHPGDVEATAASLSIRRARVEAAIGLLRGLREEIDRWLEENDEAFARAAGA
jgi:post-segregation antitoxin (ccd killing protein)